VVVVIAVLFIAVEFFGLLFSCCFEFPHSFLLPNVDWTNFFEHWISKNRRGGGYNINTVPGRYSVALTLVMISTTYFVQGYYGESLLL